MSAFAWLYAISLLAVPGPREVALPMQAPRRPPLAHAVRGEAATGEVLREQDGQLELNTTPCDPERHILVFREPYKKTTAGTIDCQGTVKAMTQAVQE